MSKHTKANVKNQHGELTVQQSETDTPILPIDQLERAQQFRPDIVDFILQQTKIEAEHRRIETTRVNTFIFIERTAGQLFALFVGICGIGGGAYVSLKGEPWAGVSISTAAITGLAVAFILGRKKDS